MPSGTSRLLCCFGKQAPSRRPQSVRQGVPCYQKVDKWGTTSSPEVSRYFSDRTSGGQAPRFDRPPLSVQVRSEGSSPAQETAELIPQAAMPLERLSCVGLQE